LIRGQGEFDVGEVADALALEQDGVQVRVITFEAVPVFDHVGIHGCADRQWIHPAQPNFSERCVIGGWMVLIRSTMERRDR
jgi:hypothetical protein